MSYYVKLNHSLSYNPSSAIYLITFTVTETNLPDPNIFMYQKEEDLVYFIGIVDPINYEELPIYPSVSKTLLCRYNSCELFIQQSMFEQQDFTIEKLVNNILSDIKYFLQAYEIYENPQNINYYITSSSIEPL